MLARTTLASVTISRWPLGIIGKNGCSAVPKRFRVVQSPIAVVLKITVAVGDDTANTYINGFIALLQEFMCGARCDR